MTEQELIAQRAEAMKSMSPGARARMEIEEGWAQQQKATLDQEADAKWRAAPVKPPIDYKGAYQAGQDFSTGAVDSRFVSQSGGFGHSPSGKPVKAEFNAPEFNANLNALAGMPATIDPTAPPQLIDSEDSVRASANLADAAYSKGMSGADFSAQLPPTVKPEIKDAVWEAAREKSYMRGAGPKLMRMQQQPIETAQADYEVDDVRKMPEFIEAAKVIFERRTGEKFTGSDADAADWGISTMRDIDLNVVGQAAALNDLNRGYSAEVKATGRAKGMGVQDKEGSAAEPVPDSVYQAYGTMYGIWDKTAMEMDVWEQVKNTGRVIADPTNLLGLGYGKVAAVTTFRTVTKQLIAAGMEKAAARKVAMQAGLKSAEAGKAAATGAVGGAIGEANLESTKILTSNDQSGDFGKRVATKGAIGAVAGAVVTPVANDLLLIGGKLVSNAFKKGAEGSGEMDAVVGNILRDRAEGRDTGDIDAGWGEINNLMDNTISAYDPHNIVYDNLIKAGQAPEEAAANASVVGAWYDTAAKHYGVTAEELFRHMPMDIQSANPLAGVDTLNQVPPAITPGDRTGAVNVTGVHYSRVQRDVLSGEHYGTGMRGAEANRVDPNVPRLYAYVDQGKGVQPESGVGGVAHEIDARNIYDLTTDPLRLRSEDGAAMERAVMERGFDGYLLRDAFPAENGRDRAGAVVLLGDAAREVPTRPRSGVRAGEAPTPKRSDLHTAFRQLADDYSMPNMATPAEFGRRLAAKNPELHAKLEKTGVFSNTTDKVRRSDLYDMANDPEAFAPYARAATFDDFTKANVKNILNRSDWAMLTAENPNGVPASPEDNAARMAQLKADLDARGIQYREVKGKYGGEENSLLLTGVSKAQAMEIGAAYDQDSVLTREGLSYGDGDVAPATGEVEVYDTPPDDFYTTIRNDDGTTSYFSVGIGEKGSEVFNQSVPLRTGKETLKKYGLDPTKKHKTRDVAAALEARQRAKYGTIPASDRSPEAARKIAHWMAEEVQFELMNPEKSGAGWYGKKFQNALDTFATEFPELATDQDARDILTSLIAITSDGQKVVPNFKQAIDIYANFRESGKLSTGIGHQRQDSIDGNMAKLQEMLDTMGPRGMRDFLMQEATVSDLRKLAKAEGIDFKTEYQAHVKLPMGAVVMGPKLGAFYANLMGAHGYLTMDRWWSRTVNRMRGTLLAKPTKDGIIRVRELLGDPSLSDDQVIAATVEHRNSYEAKNFKNGTELEKAANTLYKAAFEALEDAPFNAGDRTFMLDAVNKAQSLLKRRGHNVSVADIQAMLWYYEKRLYGDLGARQTADVSYEDAAKKVIEARAGAAGGPDTRGLGEDTAGEAGGTQLGEEAFNPTEAVGDYEQGPKGTYNPGKSMVTLMEGADKSTFAHESAHHFLEMFSKMVASPDAPPAIARDFDKVMNWFGTTKEEWAGMTMEQRRPFHERYATGFERYLRTGDAPTNSLKRVFAQFKDWLTKIYTDADQLGLPVSADVRGVFDRMLGGKGSAPGAISARMGSRLPVLGGADSQGAYNQFAGEKSVMSDAMRGALNDARVRLSQAGADAETIRMETGWFKGRDGKMRYEIDDSKATIKPFAEPGAVHVDRPYLLKDLIDHPDLFRAYPLLEYTEVRFQPDMGDNTLGWYDDSTGVIGITKYSSDPLSKSEFSTLMHEVQHQIQAREGFARGGNPESMKWDQFSQAWKDKITENRDIARFWHARNQMDQRDFFMAETDKLVKEAQFEAYQRLLGEVEARDTQWRLSMGATERAIMEPDQPANAIIKWGDTEIQASYHQDPTPAEMRQLNETADTILARDTADLLREALDDERDMPGKYISTGTINTGRLHPGAAMAKDPGRFVDQVENAEDLAKLMEYIGEGLELSEPSRTFDEVARTATLMDLEPLFRGEQVGLANDRQLYAMRSLVATLGDQVVTMAREIKAGKRDAETMLQYEKTGQQLIAVQKMLTGNVREIARALGQQRMIASVLSAADVAALERQLADTSPGAIQRNAEALVDNIDSGKPPMEALAKSLKKRTWLEASVEYWTASILTNPTTHMVNVTSGLILDAWHLGVVKPIAGAIGSAKVLAGLSPADRVTLSESIASAVQGTQGIADGLAGMLHVLQTGESARFGYGAGKVDTPKGALATKMTELIGPTGEVVADALNVSFRLLQAEDELFKSIAYRSEVAGLAVRQAVGAGLEGDAIKAHITKVLADVPDDIHEQALAKADELTLQDNKMGSGIIGGIGSGVKRVLARYPALKFLMPFVTTPVNVVVTSIENSALAAASPKLWGDMVAGGARADMAQAKIVAGTALTATAWGLYEAGLITGNGPEDWEQRKLLEQSDWQANSIRIGDKFIEINRLDPPIGGVLAAVAGAFDRARFARREVDPTLEFAGAVAAFGERTLQLPFLQGVKDLFDLAQTGLPGVAALGAKTAGGFVPFSALAASMARAEDSNTGIKVISREKTVGLGGQGATADMLHAASQQLKSRLPFARDGMRPARSWDGRVIMPDVGELVSMISPVRVKEVDGDKLTAELVGAGLGFSEEPPAITLAGVTFSVLEMDGNKGLAYDRMLQRIGETRREIIGDIVDSGAYQRATKGPNSQQAVALKSGMTAGKKAGIALFLKEDVPAMIKDGLIDPNSIAMQVGGDLQGFLKDAIKGEIESQPGARFNTRGTKTSEPITPSGSPTL